MSNAQERKTAVIPLGGPSPAGPYSPGLLVGDTLYVSGQVALDPKTNAIVSDCFEEQAHQTFRNLQSVLAAAGASLRDVVKVTVFLTDISTLGAFNAIYPAQSKGSDHTAPRSMSVAPTRGPNSSAAARSTPLSRTMRDRRCRAVTGRLMPGLQR